MQKGNNMSIIRSYSITLYGGNDDYEIVLRPLSDEHLPYLYQWNAALQGKALYVQTFKKEEIL